MNAPAALGMITAIVLVAGSCLVDRKTKEFSCETQDDCSDGRTCDDGFCLRDACPSPCDSCDLDDATCTIDCNDPNECGSVACPAGFDCTIHCATGNACDDIDCSAARGCDIDCDGNNACGAINCGTGRCDVSCSANGAANTACGAIDCTQSCDCDVDCDGGTDCASATCPAPSGGAGDCTDGTAAGCDHTSTNCERTCP